MRMVRVSEELLDALRKRYPELAKIGTQALLDVALRKLLKEEAVQK